MATKLTLYVPDDAEPTLEALKSLRISLSHEFLDYIRAKWKSEPGAKRLALMADNRDMMRIGGFYRQFKARCAHLDRQTRIYIIQNNIEMLECTLLTLTSAKVAEVTKKIIKLFLDELDISRKAEERTK